MDVDLGGKHKIEIKKRISFVEYHRVPLLDLSFFHRRIDGTPRREEKLRLLQLINQPRLEFL